MNTVHRNAIKRLLLLFILAAGNAYALSDQSSQKIPEEQARAVEESVISTLSSHFSMDPNDLESSSIHIELATGRDKESGISYHAIGDFVLSWENPRSVAEAVQERVQENVCAVAPQQCKHGFHHTIYLDVIATPEGEGKDFKLTGDVSLDRTIAQMKEDEASQAVAEERYKHEQEVERQREAANAARAEAERQAEIAAEEAKIQRRRAETDLRARQRNEMQSALGELEARQQQDRANLADEIRQLQAQIQDISRRQTVEHAGHYTTQIADQDRTELAPLYEKLAELQRQQTRSYGRANEERGALRAQIESRQAQELQALDTDRGPPNSLSDKTSATASATPEGSTMQRAAVVAPEKVIGADQSGSMRSSAKPSFDCARAVTPTEHAICSDPELSRLDGEVGRLYQQVMQTSSPNDRAAIRQDQRQWIIQRQQECQDRVRCIAGSLRSRVTVLHAMTR